MTSQTPVSRAWRKSSYSDTAQQCVEVAQAGTACLVCDTRNRTAGILAFPASAWTAFTRSIKGGD